MPYIRKGIYTIEEILSQRVSTKLGKDKSAIKMIDGDPSFMSSQRYELFDKKGVTCATCGIKGEYFAKEKYKNIKTKMWHFNLYAIDRYGNEVMMTKDHKKPRSLGGKNHIDNYQTMCVICNGIKGDTYKSLERS